MQEFISGPPAWMFWCPAGLACCAVLWLWRDAVPIIAFGYLLGRFDRRRTP
jgi:hypothetical protein